jgi:hypothetical protein
LLQAGGSALLQALQQTFDRGGCRWRGSASAAAVAGVAAGRMLLLLLLCIWVLLLLGDLHMQVH